jgi:hypothetical protein
VLFPIPHPLSPICAQCGAAARARQAAAAARPLRLAGLRGESKIKVGVEGLSWQGGEVLIHALLRWEKRIRQELNAMAAELVRFS